MAQREGAREERLQGKAGPGDNPARPLLSASRGTEAWGVGVGGRRGPRLRSPRVRRELVGSTQGARGLPGGGCFAGLQEAEVIPGLTSDRSSSATSEAGLCLSRQHLQSAHCVHTGPMRGPVLALMEAQGPQGNQTITESSLNVYKKCNLDF